MKSLVRYWFWRYIMRNRRRAGGILAAQTRKSGAVMVSGSGVPASLSGLESVADQKTVAHDVRPLNAGENHA